MTQFFSFRSQENKLAKLKMIRDAFHKGSLSWSLCFSSNKLLSRMKRLFILIISTIQLHIGGAVQAYSTFSLQQQFFLSKNVMQIYFAAKMCSVVIIFDSFSCLGRVVLPNRMNFEKNPNGLRLPPPHFWKIILQFFMTYMVAYMRGSMMARQQSEFRGAFFRVCLVLSFVNTIVEKTYPEP